MNEVEQVKAKLDIVEVIGSYMELKQAGRNFKGLSPFKSEKTPSFMVSPEKAIWHDFSSNEGGDVISFVMKIEGISFVEALEMLARRAGVELTRKPGRGTSSASKQRLFDAVEAALAYYHVSLSRNKTALTYLTRDRALTSETIKRFKLGYAPDSWEALATYLSKKGFTVKEMQDAGLVGKGSRGVFDLFRGRIMFPIFDSQGRVVGFSARILASSAEAAKYINTPATAIYNKSIAIYGLKQAKEAIRSSQEVLLVEGNMDVVALSQAGVANVVGVSGTALTEEQLRSLGYLAETLYVCFDSDEAGQAATKKAIELAARLSLQLKVVRLSSGKDPDELVRENKKAFENDYKRAIAGVDYLFEYADEHFDSSTGVGKRRYSDFVAPILSQIADPIEKAHFTKKLAQKLQVPEEAITEKMNKPTRQSSASETTEEEVAQPQTMQEKLEERLLELVLAYPKLYDCLSDLDTEMLSELNRELFAELVHERGALQSTSDRAKILTLRGETHYGKLSDHDRRMEAYTQAHLLRNHQLKIARATLSRQLAEAEQAGDTKRRDTILAKIQSTIIEDF